MQATLPPNGCPATNGGSTGGMLHAAAQLAHRRDESL